MLRDYLRRKPIPEFECIVIVIGEFPVRIERERNFDVIVDIFEESFALLFDFLPLRLIDDFCVISMEGSGVLDLSRACGASASAEKGNLGDR